MSLNTNTTAIGTTDIPGLVLGVPSIEHFLGGGVRPKSSIDPAMGYKCVCTTGTVQYKAKVQSKS